MPSYQRFGPSTSTRTRTCRHASPLVAIYHWLFTTTLSALCPYTGPPHSVMACDRLAGANCFHRKPVRNALHSLEATSVPRSSSGAYASIVLSGWPIILTPSYQAVCLAIPPLPSPRIPLPPLLQGPLPTIEPHAARWSPANGRVEEEHAGEAGELGACGM